MIKTDGLGRVTLCNQKFLPLQAQYGCQIVLDDLQYPPPTVPKLYFQPYASITPENGQYTVPVAALEIPVTEPDKEANQHGNNIQTSQPDKTTQHDNPVC